MVYGSLTAVELDHLPLGIIHQIQSPVSIKSPSYNILFSPRLIDWLIDRLIDWFIQHVPQKKPFKDFKDGVDDIFQNLFWILKFVVYPRYLKKKLAF